MARPANRSIPTLAADLEQQLAAREWSRRKLAARLGVHPSTLVRSLNAKSFSRPLELQAKRFLADDQTESAATAEAGQLVLQKLDQIAKLQHEVRRLVAGLVDEPERAD